MLSREVQSKISDIFISIAEAERDIEITRQVLTENKDYNSYQIFCYLDSDKKNYVEELDIMNYLKSKSIFLTEIEVKLVILYYNKNLDTYLNYDEFINMIESKSSLKKEQKELTGPLSFSIDYALTKLLEKEIIHAREILKLLADARGFSDFDIHNIFHFIKFNNMNFIIPQNLIKFLNKNYASFIDQDIDLIFKRIDFNKDNAIDLCEFHIFFGFPNCGYNCPFERCKNCGIECCQTCRIDGPCYVHKYVNKKDENYIQKRVYRTYYTQFQNIEKNKEINSQNKNTCDNFMMNSNGFSSQSENQYNNSIQKISPNLTIKLSPKREYAPFEVCLNSHFYSDNINVDINKENNNNIQNFNSNSYTNNYYYKNNYMNNTKNIADTLQQNFESKKENTTKHFNDNISNSEPNMNKNNNEKYSNSEPNININNKEKYNNNAEIIENNTDINTKTSKKIINSYEILKNSQNENKNRIKNKNEYEENQFIDYLREAMLHESKIEQLKINLSLRSDFNWEEVFRIFELEGRGFLSKEDLIKGFNKFGIYPKDLDISLLLKRYDLKKEGFISYPDFFDLIVPFSKYHRIMVDKRKINGENNLFNPNEFSRETLDCMRNVFVSIFNGEFILNKMRESFTSLKMKFNDIFKLMDLAGNGFLGEKELAIFLQNIGIFKNSNDCDLIFLRLNKKRNGKIDFQEMCDEIEAEYEQ